MSFNDPADTPDVVQPEGQGDGGNGGAPYQEYLDRIPEDARDMVAPVFKDWDANVTRRFQEASEFRKQWEPLKETGIQDLSPDQASYAVQLFNALEQPDVMKQWFLEQYAPEHGITLTEPKPSDEPVVDDFGFQDPSQQFEKLLEEKLGPLSKQVGEFNAWREQQTQQAAEAEAGRFIQGQITALKEKHGDFDKDTEELVNTLAGRYIESDPMNAIPRAWDDLQRWRNDVEKNALQSKVNQPEPAESGGVPDVAPPEHRRLNDPAVKDAALEFLRNQNRA